MSILESLSTNRLNRIVWTQGLGVRVVTAAVETATFNVQLPFPNVVRMNCSHLIGVFLRNSNVETDSGLEMVPAWLKRGMF